MKPRPMLSIVLVFVTTFIDILGISMVVPILTEYKRIFNSSYIVHSITFASYPAAQTISLVIMGKMSDHFGRRPLLLASLFGHILQGISRTNYWFIIARFFTGCLGGSITISMAYIADCKPLRDRTHYQSRLMGVVSAAFIIGPVVGAALLQVDIFFPLYFAGGFSAILLFVAFFFLNESTELRSHEDMMEDAGMGAEKPVEKHSWDNEDSNGRRSVIIVEPTRGMSISSASTVVYDETSGFRDPRVKRVRMIVTIIACVICLCNTQAGATLDSIYPLYAEEYNNFGTVMISVVFSVTSVIYAIQQMLFFPFLRRCFSYGTLFLMSVPFTVVFMMIVPTSFNGYVVMVFLILHAFGCAIVYAIPTIMVSIVTPPDEQGFYIGIVMFIDSVAKIFPPLWGTALYTVHYSGPWLLSGAFSALGFFFSIYFTWVTWGIPLFEREKPAAPAGKDTETNPIVPGEASASAESRVSITVSPEPAVA